MRLKHAGSITPFQGSALNLFFYQGRRASRLPLAIIFRAFGAYRAPSRDLYSALLPPIYIPRLLALFQLPRCEALAQKLESILGRGQYHHAVAGGSAIRIKIISNIAR